MSLVMANILDLLIDLHNRRLRKPPKFNPTKYVAAWLEDDVLTKGGARITALVVILRTPGCSWFRSTTTVGGCTMCGYINDCLAPETPLTPDDLLEQFRSAVDKYENKQFDLIKIFTSGSFIDDAEVPKAAQMSIMELCQNVGVSRVIFESRPEFVTSQKLQDLSTIYDGELQLAIGLETSNDDIRKFAINKGFKFQDYCNAVKIVRDFGILIKTYLLLKPLFVTEFDGISDVLQSIRALHDGLTDCISINPVNIQKNTLVEYLFNRRDYRPPWLWSVVSVLDQGYEILKDTNINLISQPTAGGTRRGAHNCGNCDKSVLEEINKFSISNDPQALRSVTCNCRASWRDTIELENVIKSPLDLSVLE